MLDQWFIGQFSEFESFNLYQILVRVAQEEQYQLFLIFSVSERNPVDFNGI